MTASILILFYKIKKRKPKLPPLNYNLITIISIINANSRNIIILIAYLSFIFERSINIAISQGIITS